MAEQQKKALLGLHDQRWGRMVQDEFTDKGYAVTTVGSLDEMLNAMGLTLSSPNDAAPPTPFAWYVMDINLGNPGAASCDAAALVYAHIRERVEQGAVHFLAISGKDAAILAAVQAGIPCMNKQKYRYGSLG